MNQETKSLLIKLADKIEIASFCAQDPSQFLRWYNLETNKSDVEYASFIAAMLSFGSRSQFIPKIKQILILADESGSISTWIANREFEKSFPCGEKKFYRFYSYDDMLCLFRELASISKNYGSLENAVRQTITNQKCEIWESFSILFPESKIVPKGKNSANKRIHMFLRWMVRQESPVDVGFWKWYSAENLLIPLDVHVMEESIKLGLLPQNAHPSLKTAKMLTEELKEAFPGDPVRGDFALFGVGVTGRLAEI